VPHSNQTKVLFIIARMNVGGPAVLVTDLIRNLNKSDFETRLVTGYCDESESDYLDEVATDVDPIRIPGFGRSISFWKDLNALFLVAREIHKFRPDIIHTHTAKAGFIGRIAGLVARPTAKRIHTYHGHLLHGYFGSGKVKLIILFEKVLGSITHKFVSIGNKVKQDLLDVGIGKESKFEVIFPGLQDLELQKKLVARRVLNLDSEKNYLVFVGRLTNIKRPERLIDLARSLKVNYPNAHVIIAGAGELLETLKVAADHDSLPITFLGWRNDIGIILSAADIAVLCSDNEGIPLTLIQASQAGLPIVSTNVGSVCDIVDDGVTGILTEVSSEGLIEGIFRILDEPKLGKELGNSGRERAHQLFSSKAMVKAHERLYSQSL
jgi:glycosyltransferase involved in cell wall biosynthesis